MVVECSAGRTEPDPGDFPTPAGLQAAGRRPAGLSLENTTHQLLQNAIIYVETNKGEGTLNIVEFPNQKSL